MANTAQTYWWKADKARVHEEIFQVIRWIDRNQAYRTQANLRHLRLYGNSNVMGLSAYNYLTTTPTAREDKLTLNVIQSMCDTVAQKIGKNRPKPEFITSGGERSRQKRAQKLTKFAEGVFDQVRFYEKAPIALRDALVFGPGIIKIGRVGTDLFAERVFPEEIKVIDAEAIHGEPRSKFQVKSVARDTLMETYPEHAQAISMAKATTTEGAISLHPGLSEMITVVEAWRLPSGRDKKDGRHVICIEGAPAFVDEPWKRPYFPFVTMPWSRPLLGYWPQGLAEQLVGIQVELNQLLQIAQRCFKGFVPKLILSNGIKIPKAYFNNDVGLVVETNGAPGDWRVDTPNPVSGELLSQIDRLWQRAFEIAGVSQLSAQSKKPAGLDSGKALREFNDIESERFMLVGQAYEQLHLDAALQFIDNVKEIAEEGDGKFSVKVKGKGFLETIDWSEVSMDNDEYVMRCFPTSSLSSTPQGRLADIQEYMQAGMIDLETGRKLMDFPDLEAYMSLANAPIEDIENQIEKMLDEGEYQSPEPFQALEKGLPLMQSAYLRAKQENVPEERLEMLRRWMSEADAMLKQKSPGGAPTAPIGAPEQPQGQPIGQPAAPPVSNLLPVNPGAPAPMPM